MCRRFVAARLPREDGRDRRGPSGPPEIRLCPAVGRQHERYGSIRVEHDTHEGPESPLLAREVFAAQHSAEGIVQTSTDVWRCRRREVGTATVTRVAVERELRDDEYRAADVGDRPSHLPSFVIEDAEPGDLHRETLAVLSAIAGGNAQEHDEPAVDPRDTLVADVDRGRAHALHDGAQLADHSSIQGSSNRPWDRRSAPGPASASQYRRPHR